MELDPGPDRFESHSLVLLQVHGVVQNLAQDPQDNNELPMRDTTKPDRLQDKSDLEPSTLELKEETLDLIEEVS